MVYAGGVARGRRHYGSGSIEELVPGEKYRFRVDRGRDPATGKRRQASTIYHGTATAAARAYPEWAATVSKRRDGSALTVRHAVERMLAEAPLAATTLDDYRRVAASIVVPYLGGVRLEDLDTPTIDEAWQDAAEHNTAHRMSKAHTVISATCRWCIRWGWIRGVNPAHGASPPEPKRPHREAVEQHILEQLLEAVARELDLYVWLRLAIVTGARRGEICGLQWGDIEWDAQRLHIARAVAYTPAAGIHVKAVKTEKPRRVALLDGTLEVLAELHQRDGQPTRPTDHVLTKVDGEPWRPDYCTYLFGKIRRGVAGAEAVKLHELRSAAASHLLAAGHDLRTVADRLGHAQPNVTLNRYARSLPTAARAAAATMEDMLPPRRPIG